MKNGYLFILLAVTLFFGIPGGVAAQTDHTILEVLIQNHKKISNRLKERVGNTGTAAVTQMLKEEETDVLKHKIDTLTNRHRLAMSDLTLLFDAVAITADVSETVNIAAEAIDMALSISTDHPEVLVKAGYLEERMQEKIEDIYKLTAAVLSSGVGVSLATNAQRHRFVTEIKGKVRWIRQNMADFYYYCRRVSWLGGDSFDNIMDIIDNDGPGVQRAFENTVKSLGTLKLW